MQIRELVCAEAPDPARPERGLGRVPAARGHLYGRWEHPFVNRGHTMQIKQEMLRTIRELPDDAGVEDAIEQLYLIYKIHKGIEQSDRGELVTQGEARQRMARWLR